MRKSMFPPLAGISLLLLLLGVTAAEDTLSANTAKIMKKKLQLSQAILAGVVKDDFVSISTSADELLKLTKLQWVQHETPEFRSQLKDFWIVVDGLKTAAAEKSSDGTTLAYVQMTLCCVKCHKFLKTDDK